MVGGNAIRSSFRYEPCHRNAPPSRHRAKPTIVLNVFLDVASLNEHRVRCGFPVSSTGAIFHERGRQEVQRKAAHGRTHARSIQSSSAQDDINSQNRDTHAHRQRQREPTELGLWRSRRCASQLDDQEAHLESSLLKGTRNECCNCASDEEAGAAVDERSRDTVKQTADYKRHCLLSAPTQNTGKRHSEIKCPEKSQAAKSRMPGQQIRVQKLLGS